MNNNKILKQLQDVQARIRSCKSCLDRLKPPAPQSWSTRQDMRRWLESLFMDCDPAVEWMFEDGFKGETIIYANRLGHYLTNISYYYKEKEEYEAKIVTLKKEEAELKSKLGIE